MALQGNSTRLQGSSGIKIQGSNYNPQKTSSGKSLQPAVGASYLQPAANVGGPLSVASTNTAPAPAPAPKPEPIVDPYAQWGGKAGYDKLLGDYNNTKGLTYGSITDAISDTAAGTKSSVLDFLTGYEQQQKGIDKQAQRSELGRETKRLGILDMIGQGLRNGQVMLNNSNASSSSAGEQIGKAYSRMGQKQMVAANTGYNLEQEDIGDAQEALGISMETFKRKYGEDKNSAANKIVQSAVAALSSLDQMASSSGVGDRINVEAEKARIRNEALASLGAIDTVLNEGVAKVKPTSRADNRAEAFKLMNSGYVPENALGFETTLPIYTLGA
jgi:hypothetical protein